MGCNPLINESGQVVGFACSMGRKRREKCFYCGRESNKLCDFKIRDGGKTCDRKICERCSIHEDPDSDFCKVHFQDQEQKTAKYQIHRGKFYDAKYRSICMDPECRRRVIIGERILWFGTGKILCSNCIIKNFSDEDIQEMERKR